MILRNSLKITRMYNLRCEITTTGNVDAATREIIEQTVRISKEKYEELKKRVEVTIQKKNDILCFNLTSEDATATDFLVPFDKQVRALLGKKLKKTIKTFLIKEYTIRFPLEQPAKKTVTVPFAQSVTFQENSAELVYDSLPFDKVKQHYVERTIKLIKDKIKMQYYEGKDEFKEYVWEGKERTITYQNDPAADLEKLQHITHTDAKGQYVFGPEITALCTVLKELLFENVFLPLGFTEMIFPKFEPWSIPIKSGHAKNVYPNAYFVSVPTKASQEYWQDAMDEYEITQEIPLEKIKEKTMCVGILSYAQCPPFWTFLKNKTPQDSGLPLCVYDWSGPTYRNESGGTHGLDRLEEFHRIEILYVGTKEQVLQIRDALKNALHTFYDEILDIELKIARVSPWWMAHAGIKAEKGTMEIGTFDFDAYYLIEEIEAKNGQKSGTCLQMGKSTHRHLM